jgi:hypothetical protein
MLIPFPFPFGWEYSKTAKEKATGIFPWLKRHEKPRAREEQTPVAGLAFNRIKGGDQT